jgi:endogenous inhibitor of DNA gyrase (YacG/DUF329 family)
MSNVLVIGCFSCGRTFVYRGHRSSGRFCSDRCREYFDGGRAIYEPLDIDALYSLPKSKLGFLTACCGCGKKFDSKALRFCSAECERDYRERQERRALMLEAPAPKRTCLECGRNIPRWRNGRQVSAATKFCSNRCGQKARRKASEAPGTLTATFERPNAKKVPISQGPAEAPEKTYPPDSSEDGEDAEGDRP